jgi:hypothetical protein
MFDSNSSFVTGDTDDRESPTEVLRLLYQTNIEDSLGRNSIPGDKLAVAPQPSQKSSALTLLKESVDYTGEISQLHSCLRDLDRKGLIKYSPPGGFNEPRTLRIEFTEVGVNAARLEAERANRGQRHREMRAIYLALAAFAGAQVGIAVAEGAPKVLDIINLFI